MAANERISPAEKEAVLAALLLVSAFGTAGQVRLGASNDSDQIARREPASETSVDSSKPALSEFLKQAQLRFKVEATQGDERAKERVLYARNFLNYARNFLNYARNFKNYTKAPVTPAQEIGQQEFQAGLPNGTSAPKDVSEILNSLLRSKNDLKST